MTLQRLINRSLTAALLTTTVAGSAQATIVNRTLFSWTGRVDREVYLTMRGNDVRVSGTDAGLANRARVSTALPRGRGDVYLRVNDGRGSVDVVEQPSARNGYTTTIRVRDPRAGADTYRVTAYWHGDNRYEHRNGNNGNNGQGGNRGNDPWDRRDDRWDDRRDDRYDNRRGDDRDDQNDDRRDDWYDRRGGDESGFLRWSGQVDDVVELRIAGRRVDAIARSGQPVRDISSNLRGNGLPARSVTVRTETQVGRGRVDVVQQPAAWNNYTAIIRINDPRGGASLYDLNIYW